MGGIFFYSEKNKVIKQSLLTNLIHLSEQRGLDNLGIIFKNDKSDVKSS